MNTSTPQKDYVEIDLGSVTLVIAKSELNGCVCQCRKHRLAAKKQAVAISLHPFWKQQSHADARKRPKCDHGNEALRDHKRVVTFDEVRQGARPCMYCMYIYLVLLPSARGDIASESFLQQQYPLEMKSRSKKSVLQNI